MKVLLVANTDWYLYNFRLVLAEALQERGHQVALVCPIADHGEPLRQRGFPVLNWRLRRGSLTPIWELPAFVHLSRIFRRERPDMVHNFTIKPDVYGTLLGRTTGVRHIVNTWTGLGYPFEPGPGAWAYRQFLTPIMRFALRSPRVWNIFQNEENLRELTDAGIIIRERTVVVRGSGVDISRFAPPKTSRSMSSRLLRVLMAARLLRDKGVGEFVQAARELRAAGVRADFLLAGPRDETNHQSIPASELDEWKREGIVDFLGYRNDLPELLRNVDIAVLPSYHEGLSRFLLEAAASGLPLVASDIVGCRPIVRHGENGLLVAPHDAAGLAAAIKRLAEDARLRLSFGEASRTLAVREFSQERNLQEIFAVYERMGALS